jgi:hypothetical protein
MSLDYGGIFFCKDYDLNRDVGVRAHAAPTRRTQNPVDEYEDEDEDDDADEEDDDADVKGVPAWARESAQNAVRHGYIKRFHSEIQCQRAYAFALIAQELEDEGLLPDLPKGYANPFNDLFDEEVMFAGMEEDLTLSAGEVYDYMMRLHYAGIIKGSDNNLNPNGGLKRAEAAVLMNQISLFYDNDDDEDDEDDDDDDDEEEDDENTDD